MLNSLKNLLHKHVETTTENNNIDLPILYDVNVGSTILKHYQDKWAELHEINENNAKNASDLAETIDNICTQLKKEHNCTIQIVQLLSSNIKTSIDHCITRLNDLHVAFGNTEKLLENLEDLIETNELQQKKIEHEHELVLYKQNKLCKFSLQISM